MKHWYWQNKGFTLVELMVGVGIISIITLSLYSVLQFTVNSSTRADAKDELLLNGRYAIELLKNDLKAAERIISSSKIEGLDIIYPANIGFVILFMDEGATEYRYVTYYKKGDKLVRLACTRLDDRYPKQSYFDGHNSLGEYVESINETLLYPEEKIIRLDFTFKHENKETLSLKADIFVRCSIDY